MLVIKAVVYSGHREVIADCYDMNVCGSGKTEEQAIENFLDNLTNYRKMVIKPGKDFLTAKWATEKCIEGLQKIVLSERNIKPEIKHLGDLEVHFYDIRGMEKNARD